MNAANNPTDWLIQTPKTLYRLDLPRGLHLELSCGQHQSGKVSIHQSISLSWGSFDFSHFDLKLNKHAANLETYDKLNKIFNHYTWLEAEA